MHTLDQQYRELKESQRNALAPPPFGEFDVRVISDGETIQIQEMEDDHADPPKLGYLIIPILIIGLFLGLFILKWIGVLILKVKEWFK